MISFPHICIFIANYRVLHNFSQFLSNFKRFLNSYKIPSSKISIKDYYNLLFSSFKNNSMTNLSESLKRDSEKKKKNVL